MTNLPDPLLARARNAVLLDDDTACHRAFQQLVADYGQDRANAAWSQACRDADDFTEFQALFASGDIDGIIDHIERTGIERARANARRIRELRQE